MHCVSHQTIQIWHAKTAVCSSAGLAWCPLCLFPCVCLSVCLSVQPANPYEVLAKMLKEKSDTYDVVAPPPTRGSKSSGSKKQAASHKLESTDDFPTLGA